MREHVAQSFWQQHYGAHVSQLDTWFFTTYMCLIAVMKKAVVPKRLVEQLIMTAAIACCMALLLLKHFRRLVYQRWRTQLVFTFHIAMTSLRAAMVYAMASEHAVHWRASHVTGGQNSDTPLMFFLVSMLGTSGGLIRNFEVLGLQQRSRLHLLVTLYFVAVQLWSSLPGFRLAHAYNFFYTVHEVYDAASALMSVLVEGLVPLPASGQAVCSACPGIIAYVTVLLFAAAVLPQYAAWRMETAALRRYTQRQQLAAAAAAAAVASTASQGVVSGASSSNEAALVMRLQQINGEATTTAAAANVAQHLPTGDVAPGAALTSQQQQQQQPYAGLLAALPRCSPAAQQQVLQQLQRDACSSHPLAHWVLHMTVLLLSLLLCWQGSAAVAYLLLPRVLSAQQLNAWCPNRPVVPFAPWAFFNACQRGAELLRQWNIN